MQSFKETIKAEEYLITHDNDYLSRKILLAQSFGIFGSIILVLYALINLYVKDYWAFGLELSLGIILASSVYKIVLSNKLYPYAYVGTSIAIIMVLQNIYSGGFENTGVFWIFMMPLIFFYILGAENGIKWIILFYVSFSAMFALAELEVIEDRYPPFTVLMVYIVTTVITLITYFYQLKIESYNIDLISKQNENEILNKLREKFIHTASHQLRTPLSSIRWGSELLLEKDLDSESKHIIKDNYKSTVELIDRLNDVFLAISIHEGEIDVKEDAVDVTNIITNELKKFKNLFSNKTVEVDADKIVIKTDPEKIRFIIHALLDNAFKYTRDNGKIKINLAKDVNFLNFIVSDNGVGIPKNEQSTLFNIFTRGSNSKILNPNSSGIGLYVTKYFVELLEGSIDFDSKENEGSTFRVRIPVR